MCCGELLLVLRSPSYLCSLKPALLRVGDFGCARGREGDAEMGGLKSEQAANCVKKRWVLFFSIFSTNLTEFYASLKTNPQERWLAISEQ